MTPHDDERPQDDGDEESVVGMSADEERDLGQIADYLCGEMSIRELDKFEKRLEGDRALRAEVAVLEQIWAMPVRGRDDVIMTPEGKRKAGGYHQMARRLGRTPAELRADALRIVSRILTDAVATGVLSPSVKDHSTGQPRDLAELTDFTWGEMSPEQAAHFRERCAGDAVLGATVEFLRRIMAHLARTWSIELETESEPAEVQAASGAPGSGSDSTLQRIVAQELGELLAAAFVLPPTATGDRGKDAWEAFYGEFKTLDAIILERIHRDTGRRPDAAEEAALGVRGDIESVRRRLEQRNNAMARAFRAGMPAVVLEGQIELLEKTVADYRGRAERIKEYWQKRLYPQVKG